MKIHTIVLDLDDTLNSLTMHLMGQLGANVLPYDYALYPTECGYDIIGAWSNLTGRPKPSVPEFWEWVDQGMWANAPKSEQFWLLDVCSRLVGKENVIIATVPTKSADCCAGKHDWIMRHLPVWCQRQYCITPRKHFLAAPGVLLVDDSDSNCDKFTTHADDTPTGGQAILCPRPWNTLHGEDCDRHVGTSLERLFDRHPSV